MSSLDRTQSPSFQLSTDYSLTRPEITALPHGVKLYALRGGQLDVVKLELVYSSAKWNEDKLGASHFTFQMLSKGTKGKNAFQIAEALDSLGTYLEIHPGYDFSSISIFTLRKNLFAAFKILTKILTQPSFDGNELRIMKEIFLQNLRVNNEKSDVVASKEIRKAIFGAYHPYGSSIEEPNVVQIEQTDLQSFFQRHLVLDSVYLVGKVSDADLKSLVEMIPFRELAAKGEEEIKYNIIRGASSTISKAGSVQSSLRLGRSCLPRTLSPRYFDAVMCNHILGGFFGSRLMKNIREEKGLTYGIYSSLHHFVHAGFWVIGAEVNRQNAAKAIQEIKHEIRILQEELISADELEVAKNYFIGSWQSENSTLFAVAEKIKSLHLAGLPDDFYSRIMEHFQGMTPSQIQASAKMDFDASDILEIQVG